MLQVFNTKAIKILLALILSITLLGCQKKKVSSISLGDWISKINDEAGLVTDNNATPYFMNIKEDSIYYEPVQNAVSWDILETIYPFDPDANLTKEWTAYTLSRLIDPDIESNVTLAKDISSSVFKDEINHVISIGLMQVDNRNRFYPTEIIDESYAYELLDKVIMFINDREIVENIADITYKDNISKHYLDINLNEAKILAVEDPSIYKNIDFLETNDGIYKINKIENNNLYLEDSLISDYVEEMDIEGNVDINFDNAEIYDNEGNIIKTSAIGSNISFMSTNNIIKTFDTNGYKITLSTNNNGLSITVNRSFEHGTKLLAALSINGVNVKYAFKNKKKNIEDAYLKVENRIQEKISIQNTYDNHKYADFSEMNSEDFLATMNNLFKNKSDVVEATLPLCTIVVPVPGTPVINLKLNLELKLSVTGKVEVVFNQNGYFGYETRNGKYRLIKDYDGEGSANINATFTTSALSRIFVDFIKTNLMDSEVELGAKANAKTIIHLYDSEGKKNSINSDLPSDYANDMSKNNANVLTCSDISANWIGNIKINSKASYLGKLGFSHTFNVIPKEYSSIFKGGTKHFENFHAVDKCTRKDKVILEDAKDIKISKKIILDSYAKVIHLNETGSINIKGLPKGYSINDLKYNTLDKSIIEVSDDGLIKPLKVGSTSLVISTKDDEYSINCNILVTENS